MASRIDQVFQGSEMAVQTTKPITVEEFDTFAALAENADKLLEYIGGEIVVSPSNPYSSEVASKINFYIQLFLRDQGLGGHVTGEAGGYMVSGERYAPDVAYISKDRQPELVREGYNPNPPQLAVEIISPSDTDQKLRIKLANYLAAGTLVWVVYPETETVEVYAPGQPVQILGGEDILDAGDALPGFTLTISDIFPAKE
jgi:Uma2 family endonuclease